MSALKDFDSSIIVKMLGDAAPEAVAAALLSSLGAIFLARFALSFFNAIWRYFIRPGKDLKVYGKWAIVTGATDGIGKALCQELAKRRINVVLISRTESRLQELSSSLEDKYQIQTRYIVLDFTEPSEDVCRKVREATSELNLGILVNNVGMSYPHAEFLDLLDEKTIADIAQVNIHGTTQMIRGVLPKFLEKKRGAVLNVGSGAATVLPSDPLYSVYAASKAYVEQLTRSLAVEYKDKGIDFQLQAPLYVATKMAKIRKSSLTVPSPETYARSALRQIGYETVCTPYWVHAFMWNVIHSLPSAIIDRMRLSMCLSIRKKAYKKKEAASKSK